MTREEQILSAAREYNSGIIFSSPSNVLHFEAGAKWADEHPVNKWHNASEEPQEYPILCQDEFGNVWVQQTLKDYVDGWTEFIEFDDIAQWAYITDLLPIGYEQ